MLGQLMWIYEVSLGRDAQWLARESRAWLSQHCVAADGVAFAMGCALRDYANGLCDAEVKAAESAMIAANPLLAFMSAAHNARRRP